MTMYRGAGHTLRLFGVVLLVLLGTGCDSGGNPGFGVDQSRGWIVGASVGDGYGVVLHTVNGGKTWLRQGGPGMIPDTDLSDIRAIDADNAWAVGVKSRSEERRVG